MFEYKILERRPEDMTRVLNKHIEDGWEYVAQSPTDYTIHITVRKPKVTH